MDTMRLQRLRGILEAYKVKYDQHGRPIGPDHPAFSSNSLRRHTRAREHEKDVEDFEQPGRSMVKAMKALTGWDEKQKKKRAEREAAEREVHAAKHAAETNRKDQAKRAANVVGLPMTKHAVDKEHRAHDKDAIKSLFKPKPPTAVVVPPNKKGWKMIFGKWRRIKEDTNQIRALLAHFRE